MILIYDKFQFLIGTVKTECDRLFQDLIDRFQFLIGTVKTLPGLAGRGPLAGVSIPHRYCKNILMSMDVSAMT